MTADKHTKRAARDLAASEGISYTAARRLLTELPPADEWRVLTAAVCEIGCDGTGHEPYGCHPWRPKDSKNADYKVRYAAELPSRRARHITETTGHATGFWSEDYRLLLALVYAMLADTEPGLLRPAELRAAVENSDQDAVDVAMEPLDRAAARLLSEDADRWWKHIKPRIGAYVGSLEARGFPRDMIEADWLQEIGYLAQRWDRAWVEYTNYNGYRECAGVFWRGAKAAIDIHLTARHGGHGPGADVRLGDGSPVRVVEAEWDLSGPPVAYQVVTLEPRALDCKLIASLKPPVRVTPDDIAGELEPAAS